MKVERVLLSIVAAVILTGCDPAQVVDKVGRRAAETVVLPVVSRNLPGGQAQSASLCIVENANASEVQALARDVAVQAGSSTVATIATIAARTETRACLARYGIPPLGAL